MRSPSTFRRKLFAPKQLRTLRKTLRQTPKMCKFVLSLNIIERFTNSLCMSIFCVSAQFCRQFSAKFIVLPVLFIAARSVLAQAPINHSAEMTIDGKTTHTYTVQFSQNGDTMKRVTSYFDASKRLVRQEISKYRTKPLTLYSNAVEDYRTGEYLRQFSTGNRFVAQRRERTGAELEEKSISAENGLIATLISEKIRQSIDAVDSDGKSAFILALPLIGIVAEMNIIKVGYETISGIPCIKVKLEPSNFFYRMLMGDPSFFCFERAKPHRIMYYKGIVGLPSDKGEQQSGIILMRY